MVTNKIIKTDSGKNVTTYGISGNCGNVKYSYDDISDTFTNADMIDKMISAVALPEHLVDRVTYALAGILTEVEV